MAKKSQKNHSRKGYSRVAIRRDYRSQGLSEENAAKSPMRQFQIWFKEAVQKKVDDVNAFVLATADSKKNPAARVVLMKGYSLQGITFFTNYGSRKGKQIAQNPRGEAVFYWGRLNRQIRLSGAVKKISYRESLRYFRSRPLAAQLAACVSDQSEPVESRAVLEERFAELESKLRGNLPEMPQSWGGYALIIDEAEFWQGRPNRMHDRLKYKKSRSGRWSFVRLQP